MITHPFLNQDPATFSLLCRGCVNCNPANASDTILQRFRLKFSGLFRNLLRKLLNKSERLHSKLLQFSHTNKIPFVSFLLSRGKQLFFQVPSPRKVSICSSSAIPYGDGCILHKTIKSPEELQLAYQKILQPENPMRTIRENYHEVASVLNKLMKKEAL